MKKILIFGETIKNGDLFLDKLMSTIEDTSIKYIKKRSDGFTMQLKNGDEYTVVRADSTSRGHKGHVLYVDKNINKEIIENIIFPRLLSSDLPEEEKIIYF